MPAKCRNTFFWHFCIYAERVEVLNVGVSTKYLSGKTFFPADKRKLPGERYYVELQKILPPSKVAYTLKFCGLTPNAGWDFFE